MKKTVKIFQWVVGLLFIFSGLIKANDPLGLSYKMQEFFEAWGMQSFNHFTLSLSIVMNIFEILLGVAMIVGWRMRLFSWLILLLTIFFAFLTGYASLSGKFQSCGCFGDCLPLKPFESFLKDIVLLIMICCLFFRRKKIKPLFKHTFPSVLLLLIALVIGVGVQAYTLKHLPVLDCLPYKPGNHLLEEMKIPPGAIADSFAITFKYRKSGKIIEFDAAHFPADFDSTYEYIDRYDKLIRQGNATARITDFSLQTLSGVDSTQQVLQMPGKYILVLVQSFDHWDKAATDFQRVVEAANLSAVKVFVASPQANEAGKWIPAGIDVFRLDAVVEKTAARVNPTYFLFRGDQILAKKSGADVNDFIKALK